MATLDPSRYRPMPLPVPHEIRAGGLAEGQGGDAADPQKHEGQRQRGRLDGVPRPTIAVGRAIRCDGYRAKSGVKCAPEGASMLNKTSPASSFTAILQADKTPFALWVALNNMATRRTASRRAAISSVR